VVEKGRYTAAQEGPIVVFIIGMRINKAFAIAKWWPVFRAMTVMLKELQANPGSGFLGAETALKSWRLPVLIQYWRSFDDLHTYAHAPGREHRPAWQAFNKAIGGDGSVGIYHETYIVEPGHYESVYANMPPFGLGLASGTRPATGSRKDAKSRLAQAAQTP
jgi:Domain of unknown function (DUF4188)